MAILHVKTQNTTTSVNLDDIVTINNEHYIQNPAFRGIYLKGHIEDARFGEIWAEPWVGDTVGAEIDIGFHTNEEGADWRDRNGGIIILRAYNPNYTATNGSFILGSFDGELDTDITNGCTLNGMLDGRLIFNRYHGGVVSKRLDYPVMNASSLSHGSGLKIQRGGLTLSSTGTTAVTFPIAFSTTPVVIIHNSSGSLPSSTENGVYIGKTSNVTTSGFNAHIIRPPNGTYGGWYARWIAIGY